MVGNLLDDIVDRLVARHAPEMAAAPQAHTPDDLDALCDALIREDDAVINAMLAKAASTRSADAFYLDYIAPAARALGDRWVADTAAFTDVTVGLTRLQRALRAAAHRFFGESGSPRHGARALLTTMPGETHAFGLTMVADFFTRDGWDAHLVFPKTNAELFDKLDVNAFDLIGLSVGCDAVAGDLPSLISAIKRQAPHSTVALGGSLVLADADRFRAVGADHIVTDITKAPRMLRPPLFERAVPA